MSGFLITYNELDDPNFEEFTYGSTSEGRRLKTLQKGDVLFFHNMVRKKRSITAYFVVEMVLTAEEAKKNRFIKEKYKNPHLIKETSLVDEVIVFGNPIFSKVLETPYPLEKQILNQLHRKPNFNDTQLYQPSITSALRTMKELNDADEKLFLDEIEEWQTHSRLKETLLSSEEVQQIKEIDIEKFLIEQYKILDNQTNFVENQYHLPSGKIIDILLHNPTTNEYTVVEIKKGDIGRDELSQIKGYMKELKSVKATTKVKGILVCKDILPYFKSDVERFAAADSIKIFTYAWKFSIINIEPEF